MLQLHEKFGLLEKALNGDLLERRKEIHTAVNALVSQKHHFQIGPPGTAKSLLVTRLVDYIDGLGDGGLFHYLLTKYSTPEELFGVPTLDGIKRGDFTRNTKGKLPRASVVFLDEIFKGNSSILNANLTAMNERKFFNGEDDPHIPLISMFAASNEMPEGEELNALWDRLHFRHEVSPITSSASFHKLLTYKMDPNPDKIVSVEDLQEAHEMAEAVVLDEQMFEALAGLRADMKEQGVEVSERRWVESLGIIKAEAFLNGREVADIEDVRPLMHVLWTDLDHRKPVTKLVLELANPIDKEAQELLDIVKDLETEFYKVAKDADNPKTIAKQAVEAHGRLQQIKSGMDALIRENEQSNRKSEILGELRKRFIEFGENMHKQAFGTEAKR